MSDHTTDFELDTDEAPARPGQLSANGHWLFGSLYACLVLLGLGFGVWAGASKPKPPEVADKPPTTQPPKPQPQPDPKPEPKGGTTPDPKGGADPKPEPKPEPKGGPTPEPKGVTPPEPKPEPKGGTTPEPKGGTITPPEPKPPVVRAVAFKEIQPIIATYCGTCHGQAGKPKGGIDLRTVAGIMKGGDNGDILKPGEPMKSKLYTSLLPGASEFMPPDGKPGPSEKEIMLIRDWIAGGAKPRRTVRARGVRRPTTGTGAEARHRVELTPEPEGG